MLPSAVALLPTPACNDMGSSYTPEAWDAWTASMKAKHGNGNGHGASLAIEAQRHAQDWGIYEPAVRRWESLTRPAPSPTTAPNWLVWRQARARRALSTKPIGHRGSVAPLLMPPSRRLSPQFSEWMMGLPEGYVTGPAIGLTRNEQLRALGNGVVWQQCALATRLWLAWASEQAAS